MAINDSKGINRPAWAWGTWILVAIQVLVFLWELRASNVGLLGHIWEDYRFQWYAFTREPLLEAPKLISHTFIHGNDAHLLGNVLFLLMFGPAVERRIGTPVFLPLYFVWGAVASIVSGLFTPFSVGGIGASGAISGAVGAFFVLFPLKTPPDFLGAFLGAWVRKVPAFFWIGLYFTFQLQMAVVHLLPEKILTEVNRVDYWAHIGGFFIGALTVAPYIFFTKNRPKLS